MVAIMRRLFPRRDQKGAELLQSITFSLTVLENSELQQVAALVDRILREPNSASNHSQATVRDSAN